MNTEMDGYTSRLQRLMFELYGDKVVNVDWGKINLYDLRARRLTLHQVAEEVIKHERIL